MDPAEVCRRFLQARLVIIVPGTDAKRITMSLAECSFRGDNVSTTA